MLKSLLTKSKALFSVGAIAVIATIAIAAVVLVNGNEATVKKLIKKENGIMLQEFNPVYEPIFYSAQEIEKLPVRVIGKVIELRGKF